MIVVSDTSALTSLLQIQQLHLLFRLFEKVVIPTAVRDELLKFHTQVPSGVEVAVVTNTDAVKLLKTELHPGEAEAIMLCQEIGADRLLIDEHRGREVAKRHGLKIIGVIGVLVAAKNGGFISAISPCLDDLVKIGFRLSPQIREAVLKDVGEA